MSAAFREFWRRRGDAPAFERWRKGGPMPKLLVRVVAPHFVAGFVIDDQVRIAAPILRRDLMGKTEQEVRAIIAAKGWRATIVGDPF